MTPSPAADDAPGAPGDGGWTTYLGALESATDGLAAALDAADAADAADTADATDGTRSDAWLPMVPDLAVPLPAGEPPAGSQQRRETLLARLALLTGRLQRRRDDVAQRLSALPSRRPRGAEPYLGALGGSVDLKG